MIARCMTSEKQGRNIFYGAMVTEGIIALIWASAGIAFYYNPAHGMGALLDLGGGNSTVVYEMSMNLLGPYRRRTGNDRRHRMPYHFG